tara:strand:+ start:3515 stop:3982 length:468 start_codon:yes stop_codon:yes gene_type:complete
MKLNELLCSVIKFSNKEKKEVFIDIINIKNSPWVVYLETKNTEPLYESFYATQNHPDHPNNYWYDITNFDKLVESIKKYGYRNELCNNEIFQKTFNGNNWHGGKGPIKIGCTTNTHINDGHHRCAILYFLYGPEFEIKVCNNGFIENIPPKNLIL